MMALSLIRHNQFYSRADLRCKNHKDFALDPGTQVAICNNTIMEVYTMAINSMEKFYKKKPVTKTVSSGVITLTDRVYEVYSVSDAKAKMFRPSFNYNEFVKDQEPTALETATAKYWMWFPSDNEIWVRDPDQAGSLYVGVIAYPALDFTEESIKITSATTYVDLPPFIIPFAQILASIRMLQEKGIPVNEGDASAAASAISAVADKLQAAEVQTLKASMDTPSR